MPQIIGGLLTLRSDWNDKNILKHIKDNLKNVSSENKLNFICCLKKLACEIKYSENNGIEIISNKENGVLIYAYFKLLRMLQLMGNAPAIEYGKYGIEG